VGLGRYVYIVQPSNQNLALCEVEIYGETSGCCPSQTADRLDVLDLGGSSARFLAVGLIGLVGSESESEFRVRGMRVMGEPGVRMASTGGRRAAPVASDSIALGRFEARVAGQVVSCEMLGDCEFAFDRRPALLAVAPEVGQASDVINISGTGFGPADCEALLVWVGRAICEVQLCGNGWLQCQLGPHAAGKYAVRAEIRGVGRAVSTVAFNYSLNVSAFSPGAGGLGGGLPLMLSGYGWSSTALMSNAVLICGAPCSMQKAESAKVSCMQPALVDPPAASGGTSLEVTVAEDVLAFTVPWCNVYTSNPWNSQLCYCEDEDWKCYRSRYGDVPSDSKASADRHWRQTGKDLGRKFSCDCLGKAGAAVTDAAQLGFDFPSGSHYYSPWAPQEVHLRFARVDIPRGATVVEARLLVTAASAGCAPRSTIRIWAEAADDSAPFADGSGLVARMRRTTYVDWIQEVGWKWAQDQSLSEDLSVILREVLDAPGWRSGSAFTLVLRQLAAAGGSPCRFLASESGQKYAPRLRITLSSNATTPGTKVADLSCKVQAEVLPDLLAPPPVNSYCESELVVRPAQNWPTPAVADDGQATTMLQPQAACCLSSSRPLSRALDSDDETAWEFVGPLPVNFTVDLGAAGASARRLRLLWGAGYATQYRVLTSLDGREWAEAAMESHGNGGNDELSLFLYSSIYSMCDETITRTWSTNENMNESIGDRVGRDCSTRTRYIRVSLEKASSAAAAAGRIALRELKVIGCSQQTGGVRATFDNFFNASAARTPLLLGLKPSLGTTAGGTRITLTAHFSGACTFAAISGNSSLAVDLGGFPCKVESATLQTSDTGCDDSSNLTVVCRSTRVGPSNGGRKLVRVWVQGLGWSTADASQVYW
jgi:hypothetical protein